MGLMTNERYDQIRDYVHPRMHSFIEHYRCGHHIDLLPYHSCNTTNKNGTRKLIRSEIDEQCVSPTWKCYWKKPSEIRPKYKKKIGVFFWTRHMTQTISRYLFKNKGSFVYNYKLKKYVHMKDTPMVYDFKDIQKFKCRCLKSIENQCRYLQNALSKKKYIYLFITTELALVKGLILNYLLVI